MSGLEMSKHLIQTHFNLIQELEGNFLKKEVRKKHSRIVISPSWVIPVHHNMQFLRNENLA